MAIYAIDKDGNEIKIAGGGSSGVNFTPGDGLDLDEDNILNVITPTRGVYTEEEFNALPKEEQDKGFYIIDDEQEEEDGITIDELEKMVKRLETKAVTMEQVNTAIQEAVLDSWEGSY